MCIEEVFDARIGMCVHVSVPLVHSHSTYCVFCVAPAVDRLAVVKSHVCFCGSLWPKPQAFMPSVFCDKRALRHTKATPFVHREASQSKSSCGAHLLSPLSFTLWHWEECVDRGEGGEGRGLLCSSGLCLSPCLFGEFADDTDQCSIFIFKTLVVCSQVHQNLAVKIKLTLQWIKMIKFRF